MRLLFRKKEFSQKVTAFGVVRLLLLGVAPLAFVLTVPARAQDFDSYKVRLSGFWAYSTPSGSLQGSADSGTIDVQQDLGFNSYSTFVGKFDWKFTRKNHLYFVATPFNHLGKQFSIERSTFRAKPSSAAQRSRAA